MRRRLLNTVACASLMLFLAAVVFWVRSYLASDAIPFGVGGHTFQVTGVRGRLVAAKVVEAPSPAPRAAGMRRIAGPPADLDEAAGAPARLRPWPLGVVFVTTPTAVALAVPYWLLCAVLFALPSARVGRWARRAPPGSCRSCGYDLRATPVRCPECGTVPS